MERLSKQRLLRSPSAHRLEPTRRNVNGDGFRVTDVPEDVRILVSLPGGRDSWDA
jgi:hypothetical protein